MTDPYDELRTLYPWLPRPSCGPGWHAVLEDLCERLAGGLPPSVLRTPVVAAVGEAQGRLRVETRVAGRFAGRVEAFVREAAAASEGTCQQCGAPGQRADRGGWWATLCERHEAQGMWL